MCKLLVSNILRTGICVVPFLMLMNACSRNTAGCTMEKEDMPPAMNNQSDSIKGEKKITPGKARKIVLERHVVRHGYDELKNIEPTVEYRDGRCIVTYPNEIGPDELGPDYLLQIEMDAYTGETLVISVGV